MVFDGSSQQPDIFHFIEENFKLEGRPSAFGNSLRVLYPEFWAAIYQQAFSSDRVDRIRRVVLKPQLTDPPRSGLVVSDD